MARLEEHALNFWKLMQKMRGSPHAVSREFARHNELPTLAATTPFPQLASRIRRELGTHQDIA